MMGKTALHDDRKWWNMVRPVFGCVYIFLQFSGYFLKPSVEMVKWFKHTHLLMAYRTHKYGKLNMSWECIVSRVL